MRPFSVQPHSTLAPGEPALSEAREENLLARVISSARLLLGQPSVTIDHEGTQYVLRATRAGKLILTK
ncbi:hemin uptake protein HemP [Aromatoleum diolicum]|uniref:Hemin uptake protein HemP n=1 Tax=Aromatoleum diolicum TaxID=75796 RepID=A0ABX1Q8W9_9RHOO|nr:hemin uptake protein HemP [Aromatoleum diolicum]NMG73832.1 hemin uptake protein HemP [Aromatoleum diolicum]